MFNWKNILLFIFLTAFAFVSGAWYRLVHIPVPQPAPALPSNEGETASDDVPPAEEPLSIAGRINILVLGEDNVEGSRRSDTIMLATLDVDNDNIRVLSVPRDTRMLIPKHGNQKINHAYAYGGTDLVRETLQRFLGNGVPISYYVKIDYDNFPKLVDMLGGVDIYVGKAMNYVDKRGHLEINIPAGKQHMNGDTALKYVRFRKDALGDIGRVQRQQLFMKAMIQKMYEPENFVRFPAIVNEIKNTIVTDMNPSMIIQLGYFTKRLDKQTDKIFFMMLPGTASIIDNLSYWVADKKDVDQFLLATSEQLGDMVKTSRETQNRNRNLLSAVTNADDYSPDNPYGIRINDDTAKAGSSGGVTGAQKAEAAEKPDIAAIIANMPEAVAVLNGNGKKGVGEEVAALLQKMGIEVVHTGNAKHFDYKYSNIIYPERPSEDDRLAAKLLAQLCGVSASLTNANKQATYPSLIVGHDYASLLKRLENHHAELQQ